MKLTFCALTGLMLPLISGCGGPAVGLEIGKTAPDFGVEIPNDARQRVKLSSFKGKVVMLDFWATWCGPCLQSMPTVESTYRKYRDKGFHVMGITNDPRATLMSFMVGRPHTYNLYLDAAGEAWNAYKVEAIPLAVVIDRKGKIVFMGHPEETKELNAAIEAALAAS